MKTTLYLLQKYWRKHKKDLFAAVFSGTLLVGILFVVIILWRESCARSVDFHERGVGSYDIIISNSNDEILADVTQGKSGYKYGYIDVLGEIGNDAERFYCGVLHDEYNLYNLPLTAGRLPETSREIAADSDTLAALRWTGKCGEEITLDGETYTVTGIVGISDSNEYVRTGLNDPAVSVGEHHTLPAVILGDSDKTPIYRVDFLGDYYCGELLPGMDGELLSKGLRDRRNAYELALAPKYNTDKTWIWFNYPADFLKNDTATDFNVAISYIGIITAVLSMYFVLKSVFANRADRMNMLRRIGMNGRAFAKFYALECAFLTAVQTIAGLALGNAVYGGIFAYKVFILGERPVSGYFNSYKISGVSRDPFLYAVCFSIISFISAYLLCVLTSKTKQKKLRGHKKPRSLARCIERSFSQGGVAVIQTIALTLICFSVIMGCLFYSESAKADIENRILGIDGKINELGTGLMTETDYRVGENGVDMNTEGIAEYYRCSAPMVNGVGHMDNSRDRNILYVNADSTKGFGDDTAEKLPPDTVSFGTMEYVFLASDEPVNAYGAEIDLSNEEVRNLLIQMNSDEYKNFFDDGQLGSKHLYQAPTKLIDSNTAKRLSEYVADGEIDIDAINCGEEIIVTYSQTVPPFAVGNRITIHMAESKSDGYGIGKITDANVTVGALVKIPKAENPVLFDAACSDRQFNLATTSAGALAIGAPCANYTQAYAYEEVEGSPFPITADPVVTRVKDIRRADFISKMTTFGSIAVLFILMSLLGFAAYFNGIGVKIRSKRYEISVLRAEGMPLTAVRKRIMLSCLKIPLISCIAAYVMIKAMQIITKHIALVNFGDAWMNTFNDAEASERRQYLSRTLFLTHYMWVPNAEIPTLIVFAVLCAVTFILTAMALKKFRRDIAFDLSSGRMRQ